MVKRISTYGIFTAVCLVLSFVESLLPLSFIAPGVKLGLANSVALLLLSNKDYTGAFLVNIARILLSCLLFSSPFSLIFALSGGVVSLIVMCLFSKFKSISVIGFSALGAVTHNLVQALVAFLIFGEGILYYLPILILSAIISGAVIGVISYLILKKLKTNWFF